MKIPYWPKQLADKLTSNKNSSKNRMKIIFKALGILGNPQDNLQNVIHVAGTNGKGSTCNFIRQVLENHGKKVNLYTSPHLINFNERFYIQGKHASDEEINEIIDFVKLKLENKIDISYFEASTIYAILLFNKFSADYNIFEVGLGGRLDATNIFKKSISVITSISFDHMEILGNTLSKIAFEKSEIIKKDSNVFSINHNNIKIIKQIKKKCKETNSILHLPEKILDLKKINLSLKGNHQIQNAELALSVTNFCLKEEFSQEKAKSALENTFWPCRMQKINFKNFQKTIFILDGAHNENGINVLYNYIKSQNFKKKIGIFACLENKNLSSFLQYFDIFNEILIPDASHINLGPSRKFQKQKIILEQLQKSNFSNIKTISSLDEIEKIIEDSEENIVFIFGSLYYCGFILENYAIEIKLL